VGAVDDDDDYVIRRRGGGFLKGFALAAVLAAAAGGYGYFLKSRSDRALATASARADQADKELADCTKSSADLRADKEKTATEATATRSELEALRAERAETEKRLAAFRTLTEKFRKLIDSGKLQVVFKNGRMIVKLAASVLFASGSADLSKEGKDALRDVAAILRQVHDRRFMVAGHTDNVTVAQPSPFKNNLELSTARAVTVTQQLVASGMSPARLVAAGYGEFEPVRENSSEAGRHENRRIEIVLLPNLTEMPALPAEADGGVLDAGAPAAPAPRPEGDAATK
jgi:chemotaxis protein MotB